MLFLFGPVGLLIALLLGKLKIDDLPVMLIILGIYYLVLFLPAFYLHLTYFIDNRGTQLMMSELGIWIKDVRGEFNYRHEDIEKTELNLGIYFKGRIDNKRRRVAPWTNYGYLKLKFKDGKEFYLTSLMIDLDKQPFPVNSTRFRFVPYIDKNETQYRSIKAHNKRIQQDKIAEYEERFNDLTDDKLLEKITNPKRYELEARKAAENIIGRRTKMRIARSEPQN